MRTIWKFSVPVDDHPHTIDIPAGATIVHVACQQGPESVEFWADVLVSRITQPRRFAVYGTGHDIPEKAKHVGTAVTANGLLIWHLYELE